MVGAGLRLLRWSMVALAVLTAALFLINLPIQFAELQRVCDTCFVTPNSAAVMQSLGLSPVGYAWSFTLALVLTALLSWALASVLLTRRSSDLMALLTAGMLVTIGLTLAVDPRSFHAVYPGLNGLLRAVNWIGNTLPGVVIALFPDPRSAPWPSRLLALAFAIVQLPNSTGLFRSWLPWWTHPLAWVLIALILLLQGYRYLHRFTSAERQQSRMPILALAISWTLYILDVGTALYLPVHPAAGLVIQTLYPLSVMLIPVAIAIAIVRDRLWAIGPVLNRSLVYLSLTAALLTVYVAVVAGLGALLQTSLSLVGTAVVAVLVQPLHRRLQRAIDRLMYGDRGDPYPAITRLNQRLEATLTPDSMLEAIVTTVREALRLPYAALQWPSGEIAAAVGTVSEECEEMAVLYQGAPVATLLLGRRGVDDPFGAADRRLLGDLASQAGTALHAVRLTAELQRSRENLVTAREDERRRLRRDLHDGLGPALAAQSLKVGTVRHLLRRDPQAADEALLSLQHEIREAVENIRRLVYNLRPPTLDEYGLAESIREAARTYEGGQSLAVEITVTEPLPPLEAAVEVAAYRIAQEALTNTHKHAEATTVQVRLEAIDGELRLSIQDDGKGLTPGGRPGVGLASMRERAEELGGTCLIWTRPEGGTLVQASIPIQTWRKRYATDSNSTGG